VETYLPTQAAVVKLALLEVEQPWVSDQELLQVFQEAQMLGLSLEGQVLLTPLAMEVHSLRKWIKLSYYFPWRHHGLWIRVWLCLIYWHWKRFRYRLRKWLCSGWKLSFEIHI